MHCLRLIVVEILQRKRLVSESEDIKTIQKPSKTREKKEFGGKKKPHQRRYPDGIKHEKTLHIILHQENANENSNKIPLHTYWHGQNPEH